MRCGRYLICLSLLIVLLTVRSGAQQTPAAAQKPSEARLLPGMGNVSHPVSTRNPQAQEFFDQGLALVYGFNHDEAVRSFQAAADRDPKMAMAWWGIALAVGPNYNLPVDKEREAQAYAAIQKALALSKSGPPIEHAYIEALSRRYTDQPNGDYQKLEMAYHDAMRRVVKDYPDDLDAATLFAESGMNLRPWQLWNNDGTPAPGTDEIVATLESVLQRDPSHIGANHYYIHAVEASPHPERALASAQRLAALAPASGHLVHMPGHIYIRTGDHLASEKTNQAAARADENYIALTHAQGVYPMMYYSHNLDFIVVENCMMGRYAEAAQAAKRLQAYVQPMGSGMPMVDTFLQKQILVLVRFQKWDEILKLPQPDTHLPLSTGMWNFARAQAFANQRQIPLAQSELAALNNTAPEIAKVPVNAVGLKNSGIIPKIAALIVEARIAQAQNDVATVIARLREAVALQDSMDYNEPPDWFYPVRESLGAALLVNGVSGEAEKVFRKDLELNPRNPRSLFGLMLALQAQGASDDAIAVQQQYEAAWQGNDSLQLADLWGPAPANSKGVAK